MATEKQLLTPVLRFNNCQATKSGSTSRLESVIFSLLVVLMRIFLKKTTCIVPRVLSLKVGKFIQSAGGGGGKVDIEKKTEQVTKIKSDQRFKFSSPQ